MKTYINYLSLLIFCILLGSCQSILEEDPKSQLSPENYYQTAKQAEAAVVGVYNALQRAGVYGDRQFFKTTDVSRTAFWNTQGGMGTYSFSGDNIQVIFPYWGDHFKGVNEANAAITNIPNIDMDEDQKNQLLAEARFIRALLYFNLVRYFGDVPYFETETVSLDNLLVPRDPTSMIYEKIIADLEFGIQHLKTKAQSTPGRATRGAAKTLLAKVYLTRASMTKRDGTGDSTSDFQMAATLAGEIINIDQEYQLVPYFPDVFTVENENNSEIIFDVQFQSGGVGEGSAIGKFNGLQGPIQLGGSFGNIHATQYFHTIFEPTDLVRFEWSTPHIRVLDNGTLRTNYGEMFFQAWKIGKYRRYPVRNANYVFDDGDTNYPVFRYAEVLLIYAEALNEVNNGPNASVFNALNQLRDRARNVNGDGTRDYLHQDVLPRNLTHVSTILPDISLADYPDYDSMKEYIMFERARELGGEGKRWFDLVRWGNLVERIKFLGTHTPRGRTRPEDQGWDITASNVAEHHKLFPIPNSEIQANPKLTQNPGY